MSGRDSIGGPGGLEGPTAVPPVEPRTPDAPPPAEPQVKERFERALEKKGGDEAPKREESGDKGAKAPEGHHLPVPARRSSAQEHEPATPERHDLPGRDAEKPKPSTAQKRGDEHGLGGQKVPLTQDGDDGSSASDKPHLPGPAKGATPPKKEATPQRRRELSDTQERHAEGREDGAAPTERRPGLAQKGPEAVRREAAEQRHDAPPFEAEVARPKRGAGGRKVPAEGSSVPVPPAPQGENAAQQAIPATTTPSKHAKDDKLSIDVDEDEPSALADIAESASKTSAPQRIDEPVREVAQQLSETSSTDRAEEVAKLINKLAVQIQRSMPSAGAAEVRIVLDHDTLQGASITINRTADGVNVTFDAPNQNVREDIDGMKDKLCERLEKLTGLPAKVEVLQEPTNPVRVPPSAAQPVAQSQAADGQGGQQPGQQGGHGQQSGQQGQPGDGRSRNRRDPYEEAELND